MNSPGKITFSTSMQKEAKGVDQWLLLNQARSLLYLDLRRDEKYKQYKTSHHPVEPQRAVYCRVPAGPVASYRK